MGLILEIHEHDLIVADGVRISHISCHLKFDFGRGMRTSISSNRLFSTGQLAEKVYFRALIEIVRDFLDLLVTFPWARNEQEDMFVQVRGENGMRRCECS